MRHLDSYSPSYPRLLKHGTFTVVLLVVILRLCDTGNGGCSLPIVYGIESNLRVIQNQKQLWAAENKKSIHDTPTETDLAPYFSNGRFPNALIGETYRINPIGDRPVATVPRRVSYGKTVFEAGSEVTLDGDN